MKIIKILGSGCTKCQTTQQLVEDALAAKGLQASVEKVQDMQSIARYGVMRTPAVVIDEKLVHAGGVPSRAEVDGWLKAD
ncbi:MAG TPA: thioredoxin family protein [Acidocella sp.]|jgi:small redox-active disulfide protein 2|nr:MAG: thioredoxin family protein [Acidocella sp. 20-58-15]HQT39809.1 thioredoxin family protein [Acidocella sp.]